MRFDRVVVLFTALSATEALSPGFPGLRPFRLAGQHNDEGVSKRAIFLQNLKRKAAKGVAAAAIASLAFRQPRIVEASNIKDPIPVPATQGKVAAGKNIPIVTFVTVAGATGVRYVIKRSDKDRDKTKVDQDFLSPSSRISRTPFDNSLDKENKIEDDEEEESGLEASEKRRIADMLEHVKQAEKKALEATSSSIESSKKPEKPSMDPAVARDEQLAQEARASLLNRSGISLGRSPQLKPEVEKDVEEKESVPTMTSTMSTAEVAPKTEEETEPIILTDPEKYVLQEKAPEMAQDGNHEPDPAVETGAHPALTSDDALLPESLDVSVSKPNPEPVVEDKELAEPIATADVSFAEKQPPAESMETSESTVEPEVVVENEEVPKPIETFETKSDSSAEQIYAGSVEACENKVMTEEVVNENEAPEPITISETNADVDAVVEDTKKPEPLVTSGLEHDSKEEQASVESIETFESKPNPEAAVEEKEVPELTMISESNTDPEVIVEDKDLPEAIVTSEISIGMISTAVQPLLEPIGSSISKTKSEVDVETPDSIPTFETEIDIRSTEEQHAVESIETLQGQTEVYSLIATSEKKTDTSSTQKQTVAESMDVLECKTVLEAVGKEKELPIFEIETKIDSSPPGEHPLVPQVSLEENADGFSKSERQRIANIVFECHGFFPDMRGEDELSSEVRSMRKQPKSKTELAAIKEKYASIPDEAERVHTMLIDLGMMESYDHLEPYSDDFDDYEL